MDLRDVPRCGGLRSARHRPATRASLAAQTLLLLWAVSTSVASAVPAGSLEIHRRRVCAMETLARTAFADVANAEAFFDHATSLSPTADAVGWTRVDTCGAHVDSNCESGPNVALADGKLALSASAATGGARVSATIQDVHANATTRLRVHASFPGNETTDHGAATITLSLPHGNGTDATVASLSVLASPSRLRLAVPTYNWSVELPPPCPLTSPSKIHVVDIEWTPTRWLRWHWDTHLLHETRLPKTKRGNSTASVHVELSLAAAGSTAATFHIKTLELQRVASGQDDGLCRPRVRSPEANCRHHSHFEPRLGADQGFLSLAQIYDFIRSTPARFPPQLTKLEEIGVSTQNRSLLALCVGACSRHDPPQVLFTAMHHSREPISMMNLVYMIDLLALDLANGVVDTVALLLSRQLWFVLVVNPDGYARNEELQSWTKYQSGKRKNGRAEPGCARDAADSGVDLNRNYDVCFSQDSEGSSTDPCGEDYRGPKPFSEPETLAIKQFVERPSSHFTVSLNYHSFGRFFNVPFACKALDTPRGANLTVFEDWAKEMTRFNGFAYGQPWKDDNLYSVNGETSDWLWTAHGIFAMSPEVGPSFSTRVDKGFWPAPEEVPALAVELHYSNLVATRLAGPQYEVVVTNVTRQPAAANSDEQEKGSRKRIRALLLVELAVRNQGLRAAGDLEIVLTTALVNNSNSSLVNNSNSSIAFTTSSTIPAADLGTVVDATHKPATRLLAIPESSVVHIIVRDALSCQYIRLRAPKRKSQTFQQWDALELPLCGFCRSVGRDAAQLAALGDDAAMCASVDDLFDAKSLSRARSTRLKMKKAHQQDSPSSVEPSTESREATLTTAPVASSAPVPSKTPAQPTTQETRATSPPVTSSPSIASTSPPPSATVTKPVVNEVSASTNTSVGASSTLASFASVPLIATLCVVAVIAVVFVVRRRRRVSEKNIKGPAVAGGKAAAKPGNRKKYVKVVKDEAEAEQLEADDQHDDDGDDRDTAVRRTARSARRDDSDDDEDAEYGRRRGPSDELV